MIRDSAQPGFGAVIPQVERWFFSRCSLSRRGGRAPIRGRFGVVGSIGQESGLRVRGGPDWVRNEQYTIEAIADMTATIVMAES